jgi:hypothetical protein
VKTFSASAVVSARGLGSSSLGISLAMILVGSVATAGCARDAKGPVSPASPVSLASSSEAGEVTTTSATVATAPRGRADALLGESALDPDGPTSAHVPARLISDAPALGARDEANAPIAPVARWSSRYPDAARMLAAWTREHEATSRELGRWAARNPEQMKTLVDWAITNESETVGAFFFGRSAFTDLRRIADGDRPAVDALVLWIRSARPAAKELAVHPTGLTFATNHEEQLAQARQARTEEPAAAH